MGNRPMMGLLAERRLAAIAQLAQQPSLTGLVAGQKALELLADLGGLVSRLAGRLARGLIGIVESADELGELSLHRRKTLPSGHAGREIELAPFRMVAWLGLQLGKTIEQIIDKPRQPLAAFMILRPIEHGQDRWDGDRLNLLASGNESGIVGGVKLLRQVIFFK